ncbi:hypothetical protein [Viscerimonas tarda]
MKRVFVLLLFNSMICFGLSSQNLIRQIDSIYQSLDTISYFENMILSFKNYEENIAKEWDDLMVEFSIERGDKLNMDSLHRVSFLRVKERCDDFIAQTSNTIPVFVLNLVVKKDGIDDKKIVLETDTGKLNFNLFYLGGNYKGDFYVYTSNGEYSCHDSRYIAFAPKLGRNAPKAFKKIMRKSPKHLLYCYQLEYMNTILYLLNNKIYVYRIIQMEEYELYEYLQKFGSIIKRNVLSR